MHKFDNPTLQTKNYLDKIFCFCIKIFKFRRKGIEINQVLSCHIKKGTRMRKKKKKKINVLSSLDGLGKLLTLYNFFSTPQFYSVLHDSASFLVRFFIVIVHNLQETIEKKKNS